MITAALIFRSFDILSLRQFEISGEVNFDSLDHSDCLTHSDSLVGFDEDLGVDLFCVNRLLTFLHWKAGFPSDDEYFSQLKLPSNGEGLIDIDRDVVGRHQRDFISSLCVKCGLGGD